MKKLHLTNAFFNIFKYVLCVISAYRHFLFKHFLLTEIMERSCASHRKCLLFLSAFFDASSVYYLLLGPNLVALTLW
jgi:hypothetical protein